MTLLAGSLIVDGVRLVCRDHGQGTPVIFIHGTPSHSYEWRDVVPHIEADGFRVVTCGLLGHSASERPVERDTSVAARTGLLAHLLDAPDIGRADIAAHEIGGATGLRFAVAVPKHVAEVGRVSPWEPARYLHATAFRCAARGESPSSAARRADAACRWRGGRRRADRARSG